MILTLHDYWSERGCVILQPYDMEMGAGTFHPATTLRALGPDSWNAAFAEATAASTSAAEAKDTFAVCSPVAGSNTGPVHPDDPATV